MPLQTELDWIILYNISPVDNFGTVVGENPDCLLLSGTVVGENLDHVCWERSLWLLKANCAKLRHTCHFKKVVRLWFIQHNLPDHFYRGVEGPQTGFTMFGRKLPKQSLLTRNSSICESISDCIQVLHSQNRLFLCKPATVYSKRRTHLRWPHRNDAKIAEICNLWTFWPVIFSQYAIFSNSDKKPCCPMVVHVNFGHLPPGGHKKFGTKCAFFLIYCKHECYTLQCKY